MVHLSTHISFPRFFPQIQKEKRRNSSQCTVVFRFKLPKNKYIKLFNLLQFKIRILYKKIEKSLKFLMEMSHRAYD